MTESTEDLSLAPSKRAAKGLDPYAATSVPKPDKGFVSPVLRIMSRVADHARAGMRHPIAHVVHPEGSFTNVQVAQLKADPNLVVEEVVDGKVDAAFDPTHTERQLDAHLAHDPVGLVNLIRSMGPRLAQVLGGLPIGDVLHVSQEGPGGASGSVAVSAEDHSGVEQESARQGHVLEVDGANPFPAPPSAGEPPPPPPAEPAGDEAAAKAKSGKGAAS